MRKQAGILFLIKIFRIPLNLLLLSLTAKYFGVSVEKDVWILAFTTMTVIDAALWGPINETFRTKFVFLKEQNSANEAISQTQSLLTYFLIFSLILMSLIMLFPNFVSQLIAPNYGNNERRIVSGMLFLVAPVLLFNQLIQIGISILNAYEVFFIAEISGFISTIINIILLYFMANDIGISALPVSYYISSGLMILFIILFIIKQKIPLFTTKWNFRFQGFKMFFLFAMPFFFPYFFGQINGLVEKILAGKIGNGTVSIIDFSNRIPTMMYGIIINIITTLLVPVLSKYYIRNDAVNYNTEFKKIFNIGLISVGILVSVVAACSSSIVTFLYDKGTISKIDLNKISVMSIFYSFSIIGIFIYIIFGMSLLSSEKQKYYAFLGMMTQIGVICINLIFVKYFSMYIFPLSIFICHLIFGILMFFKYPYKDALKLQPRYFIFVSLLIAISYFFISRIYLDNIYTLFIVQVLIILLFSILLAHLCKLEEKQTAVSLIKSKLKF